MAIYHFSAQMISRSTGRSAVAAAAYRAVDKLTDERTGETYDYTKKLVDDSSILAPKDAPAWVIIREKLWNQVELMEKRKDAQLCREINVALPRELTIEQQRSLVLDYAQKQFVDRGMVADITFHRNDPGNPHAHIMLTTRNITAEGFGQKNRDWNQKEILESWREEWAKSANNTLERSGFQERIDHRSLKAQGIEDRLPTIHEGPNVREMEQRGLKTDRGDINRLAKEHNAIVLDLAKYREEKEAIKQRALAMSPQQQERVQMAQEVVGRVVDLPTIQKAYEVLNVKTDALDQQEKRLEADYKPFQQADHSFKQLDQYEKQLQEVGTSFKSENRKRKSELQDKIAQCKQDLKGLGFTDRDGFESRKAKFVDYRKKELDVIRSSRMQNASSRITLNQAEVTLQEQLRKAVVAEYPKWPAAKHLSYKDALALKAMNERMKRTIQPSEIQKSLNDNEGRFIGLKRQISDMEKMKGRLHGAAQWLEKYEIAETEASRLDSLPNRAFRKVNKGMEQQYKQQTEQMKFTQRLMGEFGVFGREDYNQKLKQLEESFTQKPIIESEITRMQPGMNLLTNAMNSISNAIHSAQREQQMEQMKAQAKTRVKTQDQDRGHER